MTAAATQGPPPRCTYRVQLHRGWTFDDAAAIVPRLARLGVSHLYCSPILQAAEGSEHGYDVVDHDRISDDLGGPDGLARLVATLRQHGMGLMVDIVPNHMARDGRANRWWWDVLANGPDSRYARHFDIEWQSADPRADWTVLVPILGDHYGRELEAGSLRVERDGDGFVVRYHDHELPLAPGSIDPHLDDAALAALSADPDALDEVLGRQHYRLAHWRTADEELDYRRFFNIDTLVGLRAEDDQVFADVHRTVLDLVANGAVDDLRIDHVDGLRDPEGYLHRLRREVGAQCRVVVEKILEGDEQLPDTWPVDGTTGYEFAHRVDGLLVDPAGEEACTATYRDLTGVAETWDEVVTAAKHQVMSHDLASEVGALTRRLAEICAAERRHRDHTRRDLHHAVRELLAAFDVYRTYVQPDRPVSVSDVAVVRRAVALAARRRPDLDGELLSFLGDLLLLRADGRAEPGLQRELALRFPQVAAPVMAKGVEDTAFYRYHRLASLCEVGGDPGTFGRPVSAFHEDMAATASRWPATMLALSTHDSKRSADVRARLHVLSRLPGPWRELVSRWFDRHGHHRGDRLDANTEYLLYQTLLGAWPLEVDRLVAFAEKATKEAKLHTSWTAPDPDYDAAVERFCRSLHADPAFRAELGSFLAEHRVVERGRAGSLVQVALACTCPGVPDLYQGDEVWNLSLVDPDNRRAVDHERIAVLDAALPEVSGPLPSPSGELDDPGGVKLALWRRLVDHRRRRPDAYRSTTYEPLAVHGTAAERTLAFTRGDLVAVAALGTALDAAAGSPDGAPADAKVDLPRGSWAHVLTGERHEGGPVERRLLLGDFPVAVLEREGTAS